MSHRDEKRSSSISSDAAYDDTPKLDSATKLEIDAEADAHLGVRTVEAAEQVYGRYSKWFLFIGYVLLMPYRYANTF